MQCKYNLSKLFLVVLMVFFVTGARFQGPSLATPVTGSVPDQSSEATVLETYGKLPLSFEANQGQTDGQVKFLSRGSGYSLFLTPTEAVLALSKPAASTAADAEETQAIEHAVLRMQLIGANPNPRVTGLEELPGKVHYFIGNDPTKWRTDVPTYAKVKYQEVYPGVDLVYYGNQRQLEYDFVVAPGVNPQTITLDFEGADSLEIDAQGNLILHTEYGQVIQHAPVIYQEVDGVRREISGSYVLKDRHQIGFEMGAYDASKPLIIDPVLVYSTYLGGSGYGDKGFAITVDSSGNTYITGSTNSSDFPLANAMQPSFGGSFQDSFVTKLNATGTALVYSTFLGGNGADYGFGIIVDTSGNLFVTGTTNSTNFPTANPLQSTNGGNYDAFITKLDPTGSTLGYSTYLGGFSNDSGESIAVDSSGNAYVAGWTRSSNFPTTPGALQTAFGAVQDAFLVKLLPTGSTLGYSTFLGGSGSEYGVGIASDSSGNTYIAGITQSTDFPTTPGVLKVAKTTSDWDAFVAKLNATGTGLIYSTYLGGSGNEVSGLLQGFEMGIAVDTAGSAYVTGRTSSSADFPTVNPLQPTYGGGARDAFVSKLNLTGSALVYSTYLGGSSDDEGFAIAVDTDGNAYVTGLTKGGDFPTIDPLQPPQGSPDAFVAKLDTAGTFVYSTRLGGSGNNIGHGIAVDASGDVYVTGQTTAANFPTVNPLQAARNGSRDAFVTKIGTPCSKTVVNLNDSGSGSLREAIDCANTNVGLDTIDFNIPGAGPYTIQPASALPTITDPVIIDGTTQPGFGGSPIIELDGSLITISGVDGLNITAGNSTVRGLVINRFSNDGIELSMNGSNVIEDNFIGTDVAGTVDLGNGDLIGLKGGVRINNVPNNTIARNLISGNSVDGILVTGNGATGNIMQGNFIGTNVSGTAQLGNGANGIDIRDGANNTIGGTTTGDGNLISGNDTGISIGDGSTGNTVQGNLIGTDVNGTAALGNNFNGISIGTSNNTLGGTTPGARNIISGNGRKGIEIRANNNFVQGNFIGTDVDGNASLGNGWSGVSLEFGASNNIIGGTTPGARNIISGNNSVGIDIDGTNTTGNVVQGNFIGTDVNGTQARGNAISGVVIDDAADNIIGGATPEARNVISSNKADGVTIYGRATRNLVQGNFIGTDVNGTGALGNSSRGVQVHGEASNNTIGGTESNEANIIAHNGGDGVLIESGSGNDILSNAIFSNTGLGIDLTDDGVTPNDTGDGDTGANNLQNFPVLTSATSDATSTTIEGTLNSAPDTDFILEFFSNSVCDPSDFGEGETFLGSDAVTTDSSGNASFSVTFPTPVPLADSITATATDPDNNTSEFSECGLVNPPAKLTVTKVVVTDDGGTKVITDFPLFVDGSPVTSGDQNTFSAGIHTVSETGDPSYAATIGGDCASDGTITLNPGDVKSCTITNDDIAPTLTLVKTVINDNGGTLDVPDFPLFVDGTSATSGVPVTLNAGSYTASETQQFDYAASAWGDDCAADGSVTLSVGENKTCTITNDDIAPKLTVTKVVVNYDGGTKTVSDFPLFVDEVAVTSGDQNTFSAGAHTVSETEDPGYEATISGDCDADGTITLNPGDVKECTITNDDIAPQLTVTKVVVNYDGGTKTVSDFPLFVDGNPVTSGDQNTFSAGTHTVGETGDPGYAATIGGDCAPDGTITLNPGDVKSCTITNDDTAPTITLIKNVVNDDDGNAGANDFGLSVGGTPVNSGESIEVDANTPIAINEAGLAGYTFVAITGDAKCPSSLGGTSTLDLGENLSCTITNDDIAPKLTVTKVVVNDDGGTKVVTDFPLFVDGNPVTSGIQNTFNAGAHTVSETGDPGYTATFSGDCAADGTITLNPGDVKECTITNDDIPPPDNVGPVTSNVVAIPNPVAVGTNIALNANVDDTTTGGSNIASAEYSIDGDSFSPMVAADSAFDEVSEDVTANIGAFAEPDVLKICVYGTDAVGNVGAEECIFLAVYDPDGGFVTGGGWIWSEAGFCKLTTECEGAEGKANFGFVSKYKQGADTPTGETEFQFKAGNLNFHSDSYEWLVVAGHKAMYKGVGTINGAGNYGFMLSAIDEKLTPSTDVDLFRIKIWDKDDDDAIVYDNQMGDSDDAEPATDIGGGSIVIHKAK